MKSHLCTLNCIDQPVSCMVLEQYKLGELDAAQARATQDHLDHCPACTEVFHYLEADQRELPPLPAILSETDQKLDQSTSDTSPFAQRVGHPPASDPVGAGQKARQFTPWAIGLGLATAAAVAFFLVITLETAPTAPTTPPARLAIKGGDLALTLIRNRDNYIRVNPLNFKDGDIFRIELTSPGIQAHTAEVVVLQNKDAFFPYREKLQIPPGNRKSIPGAFTLDGDHPVTVCVLLARAEEAELPTRSEISQNGLAVLPETTVCVTLNAADD